MTKIRPNQIRPSSTVGDVMKTTATGVAGWAAETGGGGGGGGVAAAARAYRSSALTGFPNATPTVISLDGESFDTGAMHDNSTNPSRITVPVSGKYFVTGRITYNTTSGSIQARINVNGSFHRVETYTSDLSSNAVQAVDVIDLVAGDYVELFGYQTSGGTCTISNTTYETFLTVALVGGGGGGGTYVGVKVTRTAAYNLASAAFTAVPWDTETWDTAAFHDTSTNNDRLTVPAGKAGKYAVSAGVGSAVGGVTWGRFLVAICKNGVVVPGGNQEFGAGTNVYPMQVVACEVDLAVGDYIDVRYYQDSGAVRAMDLTQTALSMHLIQDSGGGGGAALVPVKAVHNSGNITVTSATYAAVDTATDLVVPGCVAGDEILVGLSALWDNASARWGILDAATWVGSAAVNYVSGQSGTGWGVSGWRGNPSAYGSVGNTVMYTVQAGDIVAGTVTLRLVVRLDAAGTKTLAGDATNPIAWNAVNLTP